MTPNEHDPLIRQLLELVEGLDAEDIPIILGGGMSLYLRQRYLSARTPRYPFDVAGRSTADLDLFLASQVIADSRKIESLKQVIARLGYQVLPEQSRGLRRLSGAFCPGLGRPFLCAVASCPAERRR